MIDCPKSGHWSWSLKNYVLWTCDLVDLESSIDEAMVLYTYDPIRVGFKIWCHNFILRYLIDFDVYEGARKLI